MNKTLKPYIIYDYFVGRTEYASLCFHFSAKAARRMAYHSNAVPFSFESYVDVSAELIRDDPTIFALGDQEKIANNEPHIIGAPASCQDCGVWGAGCTPEGECHNCGEYVGDELFHLLTSHEEAQNE